MRMTITEKILARGAGKWFIRPGEIVEAKIDTLMMHDITSTGAIKLLKEKFKNRITKDLNIVVTPDHYDHKDIESAGLYKELMGFCKEHKKRKKMWVYPLGENYGICHVMLPQEGHIRPGDIIVGGDSHTCTYGALGAFSTGIGTTEVGNVLATGKLWFKVPESLKIRIKGEKPENIMAKDIFLHVVGNIGVDGALYQAMEWGGEVIDELDMDERLTLTNMAIEAGAKSGIIEPDKKVFEYLKGRLQEPLDESSIADSDPGARYVDILEYDISDLGPLVAKPNLPSNVVPASELEKVKIDQAFIGSCTGAKLYDLKAAAEILKDNKKAEHVRLIISPATQKIYKEVMQNKLGKIFLDAGAVIWPPGCGACLGAYMGVLASGEVCISSTNRNFRGRMGHLESRVHLGSPMTVAASAVKGYIRGAEL